MDSLDYKIVRSKRRRASTAIRVTPEGVVVTAPRWVPKMVIDKFVVDKQSWIRKQIRVIGALPRLSRRRYVHGEKHLYFGEFYPLWVNQVAGKTRTKLEFLYNRFTATTAKTENLIRQGEEIKKAMVGWYLDNGKRVITKKAEYFCGQLGVRYSQIRIKRVSSIWGSCSSKNNLNFNRKLIMAPHKVVDYVVIHEVCHLVHRHHRKDFWDLVARLDPDYKKHIKWLKENHYLLSI